MTRNFQVRIFMTALVFASVGTSAAANDSPSPVAERVSTVVTRVENAVERGARAAAGGIERGARAAEHGVKVGVQAAARGIETGAKAVARVADSVAEKVRP